MTRGPIQGQVARVENGHPANDRNRKPFLMSEIVTRGTRGTRGLDATMCVSAVSPLSRPCCLTIKACILCARPSCPSVGGVAPTNVLPCLLHSAFSVVFY